MQVVTADFVKGKKVLLRYDIDVALEFRVQSSEFRVKEDFKLKAGVETLKLCLGNASKVIVIGHLGRPSTPSPDLSAKPIQGWFEKELGEKVDFADTLEKAAQSDSKIVLLENIRFFHGEVEGDIDFAKNLAGLGDSPSGEAGVYVNEAFSSHNKAASTTIVPTLLPHAAGLHFAEEVRILREVRDNPKKPFVAIMGGAKVVDKLPVIAVLARSADAVLIGGKLISEIREQKLELPKNVMVGKLSDDGFDISPDTTESWQSLIKRAKMIVWNGPLGKFEDQKNDQSAKIAQLILESGAEIVVGGGDTISLLGGLGVLGEFEKKGFVSVGGGAMLKLLSDGTLATIEALQ